LFNLNHFSFPVTSKTFAKVPARHFKESQEKLSPPAFPILLFKEAVADYFLAIDFH